MIKPLHIATVGGQPLRFFKTPLDDGRPDLPWHCVDDLLAVPSRKKRRSITRCKSSFSTMISAGAFCAALCLITKRRRCDDMEVKMRACAMIAVAYANGAPYEKAGQYLKSFDADAYDGRGHVAWTENLADAMLFAGINEALLFRKTQSRAKPFRPDGKPNRPLAAITTLIVAVDLEEGDSL